MAFKLDDLINKKKEPTQILDLSKIKIKSREEFDKYFDKIPEYKIRPEKVRYEDYRVRESEFSFVYNRKEARAKAKNEFGYADPVPPSMSSVRLDDFAAVNINWRMLTMARPLNKLEEDIFSRLVELGKLKLGTAKREAKNLPSTISPGSNLANLGIYMSKSKRGGTETRIRICKECGEELCTGTLCKEFPYESYTRMIMDKDDMKDEDDEEGEGGKKGKRRSSKGPGAVKKKSIGSGNKLNLGKKGKKKKIKRKKKVKKKDSGAEGGKKKSGKNTGSGSD